MEFIAALVFCFLALNAALAKSRWWWAIIVAVGYWALRTQMMISTFLALNSSAAEIAKVVVPALVTDMAISLGIYWLTRGGMALFSRMKRS